MNKYKKLKEKINNEREKNIHQGYSPEYCEGFNHLRDILIDFIIEIEEKEVKK